MLCSAWSVAAQAQETPLTVIYGPGAATAEGDPDYREVIFLSVPEGSTERLYLRVFDPDAGGDHDLLYGAADDTETRYTLFGGEGAVTRASHRPASSPGPSSSPPARCSASARSAANPALDSRWQTLFAVAPEQGEAWTGGARSACRSRASPATTPTSTRSRSACASGATSRRTGSRSPASRRPCGCRTTRHVIELRFVVPAGAERLTVRNFDAANATLELTSAFDAVPLAASGQDEWRETEVPIRPDQRGQPAAIVLAGGEEIPNDVTLAVHDQAGRPVPLQLPARLWLPNGRPVPAADVELLANCVSVAFDASRSSDPDGDQLSYEWLFGDGTSASGRALVHEYPGPGSYPAALRVLDSSGQIGAGAVLPLEVFVKRPPVAVAGPDLVVAPGEPVAFDGSRSQAGERPIARYGWDFYDGGSAEGSSASHAYAAPGRYIVTLRVEDDSSPPCNVATDQQIVQVNAAPVAVAGEPRRVSVGETVSLDGGRSYDVDGTIAAHAWDLGDGAGADRRAGGARLPGARQLRRAADRRGRCRGRQQHAAPTASGSWSTRRRSPRPGPTATSRSAR